MGSLMHRRIIYPLRATIYITFKCNLKCLHCMFNCSPSRKEVMEYSIFKKLVKEIKYLKVFNVSISGGEPLTHPDFSKMARYLYKKDTNWGLTTDGLLLEKYFHVLQETEPKTIGISLDEITPNSGVRKLNEKQIKKILKNISKLKEIGLNVVIKSVLHNKNKEDIIKNFAESKDISIEFSIISPIGRAIRYYKDLATDLVNGEDIISNKDKRNDWDFGEIITIPKNMNCKIGSLCYGIYMPIEAHITPTGDVYACPILINTPFKEGNVKEKTLKEIFYDLPSPIHKLDPYMGCIFNNYCRKKNRKCPHCFAVSYQNFGKFYAPSPDCLLKFDDIKEKWDIYKNHMEGITK